MKRLRARLAGEVVADREVVTGQLVDRRDLSALVRTVDTGNVDGGGECTGVHPVRALVVAHHVLAGAQREADRREHRWWKCVTTQQCRSRNPGAIEHRPPRRDLLFELPQLLEKTQLCRGTRKFRLRFRELQSPDLV